jgi:pimeloyl-ACP methyl ester carboxylesterase
MADNIVFIHGAWLASNSWGRFAGFFSERGYATLAPWEDVAQYIADWLDRVLRPAPVAIDEQGA